MIEIPEQGIVAVDIWATWCQPCKALAKEIEIASEERPDITFLAIEAEASQENMDYCQSLGVQAFPTVIVYNDGNHLGNLVGAMSKDKLIQSIEELLP